jgi:hypothetical protein
MDGLNCIMTNHANDRIEQREICGEVINFVLFEADRFVSIKDGLTKLFISKKRLKSLVLRGLCSKNLAKKASGVTLVRSDEAVLITAYRNKGSRDPVKRF